MPGWAQSGNEGRARVVARFLSVQSALLIYMGYAITFNVYDVYYCTTVSETASVYMRVEYYCILLIINLLWHAPRVARTTTRYYDVTDPVTMTSLTPLL